MPEKELQVVYLTRRQREILDFVREFSAANGYSPSLREIAEHLGVSAVSTVHEHIGHLVDKGALRKSWNRARSVEPAGEPGPVGIPLAGRVAAGRPIEAVEVPGTITVPPGMLGRGETFALQVEGDSMVGDGIFDGDMIIVERRLRVENGALAVVVIDGEEATVKRFYQEGSAVILKPSNPEVTEIRVEAERVDIRGVVVGLLRHYG
ncbi:MAG: transcriptional repressor LexA [Candidatus Latescibacteria bacterium]|nr:transcriptional repressor LexA [bacterium]MBD3423412.1 transcriptional repressor LexA [Candidatus Latescibacterota bacterium]